VFYLLGMTTLLPWNFFIAVNDYWNYKVLGVRHLTITLNMNKKFVDCLKGNVLEFRISYKGFNWKPLGLACGAWYLKVLSVAKFKSSYA
jgi:hypothetical protein